MAMNIFFPLVYDSKNVCQHVTDSLDLTNFQDTTPVMSKIYATLGRKFSKKDLEEAQRMGDDIVSCFTYYCLNCKLDSAKCQILT